MRVAVVEGAGPMTPDQRARLERLVEQQAHGPLTLRDGEVMYGSDTVLDLAAALAHIDALEARVGELTRERDVALTQAAQDYGEWEMASARAEQAEARVRELEILMVREGEA